MLDDIEQPGGEINNENVRRAHELMYGICRP